MFVLRPIFPCHHRPFKLCRINMMRITMMILVMSSFMMSRSVRGEDQVSTILAQNHPEFADTLVEYIYEKENECSSALGVSLAFSLLYPGSTGETTAQLQNMFGYPTYNNNDGTSARQDKMHLVWKPTIDKFQYIYQGECIDPNYPYQDKNQSCKMEAPLLKIANSIWLDDDDSLATEYYAVVGEYAKQIDFMAQNSTSIVNDWVENATNGLIDSILLPEDKPLYPPYVLIAVNAIYFKASWLKPFDEEKTNQDYFYGDPSRTSVVVEKAHFIHQVIESVPYSHSVLEGFQIVQLEFTASDLSMIFVLPTGATRATTPKYTESKDILRALEQLERTSVAIALPKFKFDSEYKDILKDSLVSMGLTAPFQTDDGLCDIFGYCGILIDEVIQKTVIDVNEKGVEAAAVTAITLIESAPPPTSQPTLFMADHPFQFFIYSGSENIMLFEGHVGAPPVPSSNVPPPLTDVHSDTNFWTKNFQDGFDDDWLPYNPFPSNTTLPPRNQTSSDSSSSMDSSNTTQPSDSSEDSSEDSSGGRMNHIGLGGSTNFTSWFLAFVLYVLLF